MIGLDMHSHGLKLKLQKAATSHENYVFTFLTAVISFKFCRKKIGRVIASRVNIRIK